MFEAQNIGPQVAAAVSYARVAERPEVLGAPPEPYMLANHRRVRPRRHRAVGRASPVRALDGAAPAQAEPRAPRGCRGGMAMKRRVLIVDNDLERGDVLCDLLAPGYECHRVQSLDEAFGAIGLSRWDVALTNYDLGPRQSGIELLQAMREFSPRTVRVLYCRYYCDGLAHDAARLAAAHAVLNARLPDFPITLHDTIERLLLAPSAVPPPAAPPAVGEADPSWFAESAASRAFVSALSAAAESECPVVIHGEHGSGTHVAAALLARWRSKWRERDNRDRAGSGLRVAGPVAIIAVPPLRERR